MTHLIGYARVSTVEQNLDLQRDALTEAGCYRVFTDTASGARDDRPQLAVALDHLRPGDTLAVWRLDRLGRSLQHLVMTVNDLQQREVGFRSLTESIDTTTPGGRLYFHIFAALAEFERDLIRERTVAGLNAARARGRKGGRPTALTPEKIRAAQRMYADKSMGVGDIAKALGVSRSTLYRALRVGAEWGGPPPPPPPPFPAHHRGAERRCNACLPPGLRRTEKTGNVKRPFSQHSRRPAMRCRFPNRADRSEAGPPTASELGDPDAQPATSPTTAPSR